MGRLICLLIYASGCLENLIETIFAIFFVSIYNFSMFISATHSFSFHFFLQFSILFSTNKQFHGLTLILLALDFYCVSASTSSFFVLRQIVCITEIKKFEKKSKEYSPKKLTQKRSPLFRRYLFFMILFVCFFSLFCPFDYFLKY